MTTSKKSASASESLHIASILRRIADVLTSKDAEIPPQHKHELKYRPDVTIVVVNPHAVFHEPRDPEIIKTEIRQGRLERENVRTNAMFKPRAGKKHRKSKAAVLEV